MVRRKRKKRGFPLSLAVGFNEQSVNIWKIYSESIKKYKTLPLFRKWKNADDKDKYHYYEDLLGLLKPLINNSLKSFLLISPKGVDWSQSFISHIEKHHSWLLKSRRNDQAIFTEISGNARNLNEIKNLLENEEIKEVIKRITSQESYLLIKKLEKSINKNNPNHKIFYGLKEIEDLIYEGGKKDDSVSDKVDYLLLTDKFLEDHKQKNRIYRLKQIAKNKGIKTKVILEESPAGNRISQFGGIICFKTGS